ncbi:hypothetical protein EJ04DRAFT_222001 [Polyplosphaeria fusca]|uniref:Uncharacterized protein n=1 Tax=Polyplosphaeria fusca TaxID=682080 RepID=A0A9P4QWL2_9PLEO|nr:hypothetical protein EJ04DRAFT_222001 [Polyplosphaeria fusca]
MLCFDILHQPYAWAIVPSVLALVLYIYTRRRSKHILKTPTSYTSPPTPTKELVPEDAYTNIVPLPDFDLTSTPPIKIRPFKPKYHLTMALENITLSDLIVMDNTYESRIALRKHLIQTHPQDILAAQPPATDAIFEFYTWITSTYLPQRFPTLFTLLPNGLLNTITQETVPLTPNSPLAALRTLGTTIDTDFLFLLPSSLPSDTNRYRLHAFISCFPSGFSTPQKLGLRLDEIHAPVPGYRDKLERSMDRFFASLPAGKIVRRVNWSVTTHGELFCLAGTHLSEEEMRRREEEGEEEKEWGLDKTVLRCERQTLHRLPRSGALVFGFKTYQYGIGEGV